ncbi:hypothetical protein D7V21_16245 [Acinetobacter guerrae]|uniref:Phage head morphogenesis domain-containing protein n=1 Tax=Acinetobacter guerrae TaxID=1843371 RepID=A0A3A8E5E9_9GAMM|nr:phage minor head protein [Acinetobacter guerrae]RKG30292.1 hypothetical protein D7V21_16245 [Acinetobacter guerrae]
MATEEGQFQLPFREQLAYLKQKKTLSTTTYKDIDSRQHDKAFVAAGAMKADLLSDLHRIVIEAAESGQSFKSFQDDFDDVLGKHGWLNDADKEYKAWRANVIYQTNLRTSHAAGRYKQMTDPEVLKLRPYWRYRHNSVENPRIQHQRWNNLVLPADAQFWKVNFPPNGYGCQCTVDAINDRQLRAMGKTQPDDEPSYDDNRTDFLSAPGANWYPDLDKYPELIARQYVDATAQAGLLDRWLAQTASKVALEMTKPEFKNISKTQISKNLRKLDDGEQFPVAVIPESFKTLLGLKTQSVLFRQIDAIERAYQGDFEIYSNIQSLFGNATQSIYQTDGGLIVFIEAQKTRYVAQLQVSSKGVFLKSYSVAPTAKTLLAKLLNDAQLVYSKE